MVGDMSYEPRTKVEFTDNGSLDAFGRLRVSEAITIFDSKQLHDNDPLRWSEESNGSGSTSWAAGLVATELSVGEGPGNAIRQTKQRFVYQPGRSFLYNMTGVMSRFSVGPDAISRIGAFDGDEGVYFELAGTTPAVVMYSSGSQVAYVDRNSWNVDTFDGNGPSGIDLDFTKALIFTIDFQWLGVGDVRMGFTFGRTFYPCHIFSHANVIPGVYMVNPNLPVRFELETPSSGRSMLAICSSVSGESIVSPAGVAKSVDRGISTITALSAGDFVPLVSMRLKSTHVNAAVLPISVNVLAPSAAEFLWRLVLNPTIAGTDAVSWTPLANSAVEYDITRNNTNLISGGTVIASDYGGGGPSANAPASPGSNLDLQMRLGTDLAGNRDEYVLCAAPITGTNEALIGKISFRELL